MNRNASAALIVFLFVGCTTEPTPKSSSTPAAAAQDSNAKKQFDPQVRTLENGESSHIVVQHVLVAFQGRLPGKNIRRSKAEAAALANEILAKARAGENFEDLVTEFTDDSPPGIYRMANFEQESYMSAPRPEDRVYPRDGMVPAFGDVGFPLQIGEIGMSEYDPAKSPFGWHIIKRLE